jgi:hypothetical protein
LAIKKAKINPNDLIRASKGLNQIKAIEVTAIDWPPGDIARVKNALPHCTITIEDKSRADSRQAY